MPLIRKLITVGNSKAITIPPSWLKLVERQTGETVTELAVEVDGCLRIRPVFKNKKGKSSLHENQNRNGLQKC